MIVTELLERLEQGEHVSQEFKRCSALPESDTFETICSFANRQGGSIFLGVEDDGTIAGVNPKLIRDIERNIANVTSNPNSFNTAPAFETERISTDLGIVLRVWIPAGPSIYRYKGTVFDRRADADVRVRDDSLISQMYMRKQNAYSERRIYPYVTAADLRSDLIQRTRDMIRMRNPEHPWLSLDTEHMLRAAKLYGRNRETGEQGLTLAAMLLLGTDEVIGDVLPAYKTDAIVRQKNLDRYDDRLTVRTNLLDSYSALIAFAQNHLPDPFVLNGDVRVSARNIICRELISNMLIHREYTHPFISKLVIGLDGIHTENASRSMFEGPVTLDDFNPIPKNPIIADFFVQIGWADELGSGTRNLYRYSQLYSGVAPDLRDGDIFRAFVPSPQKPLTNRKQAAPSGQHSADGTVNRAILDLLANHKTITSAEVARQAGVVPRTAQRHLIKLVREGKLVAEGTNRNRSYHRAEP